MLLMVVVVVALIRVAGRIYAGAVLRSGPRVKIKDALAAAPGPRAGRADLRRRKASMYRDHRRTRSYRASASCRAAAWSTIRSG